MNQRRTLKMMIGAAVFILLMNNMQAQEIHRFNIKETLEYGAKNSVQVKNALLDYKMQQQSNRAITSQALPQVRGMASTTYNPQVTQQSFPNFIAMATYGVLTQEGVKDGSGNPIQAPSDFGYVTAAFGTTWNSLFGVSLSQVLFDGQVFVGLQARQAALDFYNKNREVTEQGLRVNICKVYYQLLLSETQTDLLDANIFRAQELLHNTTELYKNGFAEKLDIDRVSVQLENLEAEKVQLKYVIDNGYLGLKMLLGMPIRDSLILTDTLTYDMVKNVSLQDSAYKYSDRRDFQLLEINKKLNEYDIKRYGKMYIPSVSLNASYMKISNTQSLDYFKGIWLPSSQIALNVNVPIFDGFYKDANKQKAKMALEQTNNRMEALKISIDNDVESARLKFTAAIAMLNTQKKNMELSENVYTQTRKKYEQGIGSNTEITSAQTDMKQAQTNYFNALYNAVIAKIDYENAIGKL